MPAKIAVTGMGVVSALGNHTGKNLEALLAGYHGMASPRFLTTVHRDMLVAEVKHANEELEDLLEVTGTPYLTRTALLGMMAASEALEHASLPAGPRLRIGLVSATTVGGMDRSENFYGEFIRDPAKGRLRDIISHDCGESTERIASYLGIRDFVSTISTACSSSANAIMTGARMLKCGMLDVVVAGGTDALTRFTLNGFNTLMILDKNHCRPFDDTRTGLNLGEGAGFVVLETMDGAMRRGASVLAELSGYGNANDAYHQTASSPDGTGAALAMHKAFRLAELDPSAVSYINVHGTGTPNNDLSEGKALEQIFGTEPPPFSSTKAFTGHTLAAAGGIEAVFSVLSLQQQVIFPNLNFRAPMKELRISPVTSLQRQTPVQHVLSNSFGFGGNNTTLLFSKA